MQIIKEKISLEELKKLAKAGFGNLVKAVVDIEKEIMAIDGDLHSDEEALLLENGSQQKNLWGINIHPAQSDPDLIEFDSVINIRPSQNNNSRGIDNPQIQKKIINIVTGLIKK